MSILAKSSIARASLKKEKHVYTTVQFFEIIGLKNAIIQFATDWIIIVLTVQNEKNKNVNGFRIAQSIFYQ